MVPGNEEEEGRNIRSVKGAGLVSLARFAAPAWSCVAVQCVAAARAGTGGRSQREERELLRKPHNPGRRVTTSSPTAFSSVQRGEDARKLD